MEYQDLTYEQIGTSVRISHNRPHVRNAESRNLLDELDAAVARATADEAVRVIIIAGTGDHFSAGHDLKEAQATRADFTVEQRWAYEELRYFNYAMRIWDCPKPTIAQVQGACVAGAFMLANVCDLIVASEDAYFADPVCHTLAAAATEVLVHPWVLGLRQAKEFLFTGQKLGAARAYEIGMVNRVVPRDRLESETLILAEHIGKAQSFALKLVKRSLNRTLDMQGFRNSLQAHFDTHQLSHVSEAFKGIRDRGLASAIKRGKDSFNA